MNCNVAGCHNEPAYEYSAYDVSDGRTVEHGYFCNMRHIPAFLLSSCELISLPTFIKLTYEVGGALIGCTHGEITVQKVSQIHEL